ncbi:MAG: hypothetical protein KDE56_06800 [Anaerolineales bacterium]|nr:hypothetical protein [Anaerolineales bacterium]
MNDGLTKDKNILITVCSTSLFHAPGMFAYAKTAYRSGDTQIAFQIMQGLTGNQVADQAVWHLLSGFISITINGTNVQFELPKTAYLGELSDEA